VCKLRIACMGADREIKSDVPAAEWLIQMAQYVNEHSANPQWTGYFRVEGLTGKDIWLRLRSIDIVEDI
jgi:hypothetical protein